MLQHFLGCIEKYELEFVLEIQWLRQDPEKLWLQEAHTQPALNDEFIQNPVDLYLSDLRVLFLDGICENLQKGADGDWDLTNREIQDVANLY